MNTQVVYRFALAQMKCTRCVLLSNSKQSITSLSLLVGTIVHVCIPGIKFMRISKYDMLTCLISQFEKDTKRFYTPPL